jgi:hypothetical protein
MDIDIDFANRTDALSLLKHIKASRKSDDGFVVHNTGVYFQDIPTDPITKMSSIDYKEAESRGYFKMDFLNVSLYKSIQSEEQLVELCNKEPIWELFEHKDIVEQLFHIGGHYDIVNKLKPKNVEQLAAILAIIRPGKKHLIDKSWDEIMKEVWIKNTDDGYSFKRAHSYSYAFAIIVQLNMLCDNLILGESNKLD